MSVLGRRRTFIRQFAELCCRAGRWTAAPRSWIFPGQGRRRARSPKTSLRYSYTGWAAIRHWRRCRPVKGSHVRNPLEWAELRWRATPGCAVRFALRQSL